MRPGDAVLKVQPPVLQIEQLVVAAASCCWMMAASKPIEPQSCSGLSRWQLALMIGTPIVVGVGAVYLWRRNRGRDKQAKRNGQRKTPEGSASPVHGQHGTSSVGLESMVMRQNLKMYSRFP